MHLLQYAYHQVVVRGSIDLMCHPKCSEFQMRVNRLRKDCYAGA